MRSYNKRVDSRIGADMGRFTLGTHQQCHQNITKEIPKLLLVVMVPHIKHKFLKHYQVFFVNSF